MLRPLGSLETWKKSSEESEKTSGYEEECKARMYPGASRNGRGSSDNYRALAKERLGLIDALLIGSQGGASDS